MRRLTQSLLLMIPLVACSTSRIKRVASDVTADWHSAKAHLRLSSDRGIDWLYNTSDIRDAQRVEEVRRIYGLTDDHYNLLEYSPRFLAIKVPNEILRAGGDNPKVSAVRAPDGVRYLICSGIFHSSGRTYHLIVGRPL